MAAGGGGPGIAIVDERDAVADEDLILERHAFADEGVARDLAATADAGALLDLDEGPDLGAVADLAAVEVDELVEDHVLELDVGGDGGEAQRPHSGCPHSGWGTPPILSEGASTAP